MDGKKTPIKIMASDPIVLELLPGYIKNRRLEVPKLHTYFLDKEFNKIRILGHNLKGSGGLYGLPQISEFGDSLESNALASNANELLKTIQELEQFLKNNLFPV